MSGAPAAVDAAVVDEANRPPVDTVASAPVDAAAAAEFLSLIRSHTGDGALDQLAADLARKGERLRAALEPAALAAADESALLALLRSSLATRRRASALLAAAGTEPLRAALLELVTDRGPAAARLAIFVRRLPEWGCPGPPVARDLAADLLRHLDPPGAWPWSRWIWDPATGKGAARLVAADTHPLSGRDPADTYQRVGRVVTGLRSLAGTAPTEAADAAATSEPAAAADAAATPTPAATPGPASAAGPFWPGIAGPYGPDVFLASTYTVYTYTVLGTQMTREFNRVLPPLPALARRYLGVT